jgi:hypothetical protein
MGSVRLYKKWSPLVERALKWKLGFDFYHLDETLDLIRLSISQALLGLNHRIEAGTS